MPTQSLLRQNYCILFPHSSNQPAEILQKSLTLSEIHSRGNPYVLSNNHTADGGPQGSGRPDNSGRNRGSLRDGPIHSAQRLNNILSELKQLSPAQIENLGLKMLRCSILEPKVIELIRSKQSQTTENTTTQIYFFHTLKGMWNYTAIEHFWKFAVLHDLNTSLSDTRTPIQRKEAVFWCLTAYILNFSMAVDLSIIQHTPMVYKCVQVWSSYTHAHEAEYNRLLWWD